MTLLQDIDRVLLIGICATAVLDIWLALLARMGVPTLNFAFIGRWVGHLFRGRFSHMAIGRAQPIRGELAWGWLAHYAIGIAFAAGLMGLQGMAGARHPTLAASLGFGLCTVLVPLFVMQPAMGSGFASSRTPTPVKNVLRSIANHAVFGLGLYLSSLLAAQVLR
ncbi:MAG TPA: DUF2938 domain-containing protein [Rudaea sp.]|nr:DUF2938 domain-containing protein [Rudaea sp.]